MNKEPIAIIGVGIRYPNNIDNLDSFWDTLIHKRSLITSIPENRFQNIDELVDINRSEGRIVTNQGAWIENVENFDADFFNISPREAEKLDPHQRLILEVAFQAMEDAGVKMEDLWGSLTGVFAGMWVSDFEHVLENSNSEHDVYSTTGSGRYAASGRVSFFYNLQGPSITVDTACSTSLVATHLAVQSLQNHECNAAICTAANVLLDPYISICYSRSSLLSDYGRCRFGAEDAKGYVRCEGSAAVMLKRLSDAQRDGNHIYAIIPATACNNDGQSDKYMLAPSAVTQAALIRQALAKANIDNRDIQYVEAHGTGTNAGDPIELSSIPAALEAGRTPEQKYFVGSAKTIFGHTEAVAGFTGMIKCLMAMHYRMIPGNLYADMPKNTKVPWSELLLSIPTENSLWPQPDKTLMAGVNAFGITGTNAHVLLQEAPKESRATQKYSLPLYILPISAASEEALTQYIIKYIEETGRLSSDADVFNYVKNIACRKSELKYRVAIVFENRQQLLERLTSAKVRNLDENIVYGTATERSGITFVFPGQGSQWAGMGAELYFKDSGFRASIDKCAEAYSKYVSWNLTDVLFDKNDKLLSIDIIQPAIIAIEIAVAEWLIDKGVVPQAVVGHSMGEVASAYVAGIINLDAAANIICTRSLLMKRTSGKGAMLYAAITQEEALSYISPKENQLSIGVNNSPSATVISGDVEAIDTLQQILDAKGIFCRKVKVDVASHSPHMDALQDELYEAVRNIEPSLQTVHFYSTVVGKEIGSEEVGAYYWLKNLRNSVQFGTTVQHLIQDNRAHFIECSPHPVLLQAIQENIEFSKIEGSATATLLREKPELHSLMVALSQAFAQGVFVDWRKLYRNDYTRVTMPTYPWQRERHWVDPAVNTTLGLRKKNDGTAAHPLLQQFLYAEHESYIWQTDITLQNFKYFEDHKINDAVTFPAAAYLEMMYAAAKEAFAKEIFSVNNLQLHSAILIPESGVRIKVVLTKNIGNQYTCTLLQWKSQENIWLTAASAFISLGLMQHSKDEMLPLDVARKICNNIITKEYHYQQTKSLGLPYSHTFCVVEEIATAENIILAKINVNPQIANTLHKYIFHPTLLDGCLQVLLSEIYGHPQSSTFVPVAIGHYSMEGVAVSGAISCLCKVISESHDSITADMAIYDSANQKIAELSGVVFDRLEKSVTRNLDNIYFDVVFENINIHISESSSGDTIKVIGNSDFAKSIANMANSKAVEIIELSSLTENIIVYVSEDAENDIPEIAKLLKYFVKNQESPRIYILSQDIYSTSKLTKQPMLVGFHRVLCNEHPEFIPTLIDTNGDVGKTFRYLISNTLENELQIREDGYYAARLNRIPILPTSDAFSMSDSKVYEAVTLPGMLENIRIAEKYLPHLGDNELCIRVNSVGVNFMNLMSALGIYPGKVGGFATLGIELCGTIVAIGKAVTLHQVGDSVMGMGYHTMASYVHTHEGSVISIPSQISLQEASTMPVAYLTAYYSLITLGRLSEGSRVLIHAATGGVGMAAIYIAKAAGAEIFATAGSEEKRAYLKNTLGIIHVYNSRDTDFYDKILHDTHHEGIDVVLNSLTGDQMWLSMRLLRDFGRFIEIGKKDVYENTKLGLEIFQKGLSYHMVDFEKILFEKPQWIYKLLQEIVVHVQKREYKPLPNMRFDLNDIQKAFATMATAKVIGKVVVDIEDRKVDVLKNYGKVAIDAEAAYMITGGYGGIGITYMQWLVEKGARHIFLTGRSKPQPWAQQVIDRYIEQGIVVSVLQMDVADAQKVNQAVHSIYKERPLRGVIHLAGILDDASIVNFDDQKYYNTLSPKVKGAENLHLATQHIALDFFVLMSSSALLFGSPGQSSYAAANAYLDGLARYRHSKGLPALSINLGTVSSIGLAASADNRADRLLEEGVSPLNPEDCITILTEALSSGKPVVGAFHFNLKKWQSSYRAAAQNPFFTMMGINRDENVGEGQVLSWKQQMLSISDRQEMITAIEDTIKSNVGSVVKLSPDKIASKTNFKSLGIDSLMSIQLKNKLEAVCEFPISVTSFWTYSTIKEYAAFLADKIGASETTLAVVEQANTVKTITNVLQNTPIPNTDEIADEDISKLLEDELKDLLGG